MLFPVFLMAALALFSHTTSALSVPPTPALPPTIGQGVEHGEESALQVIVATTVETLQIKQSTIENCVKEQDASIKIKVELEAFIGVFQGMVQHMSSCGCASSELVDVHWYKKTLIDIFTSVEVVIEIVLGSRNKSWILLMLKLCTMIDLHISKLIDISIRIDVDVAAAVRDNVHGYAWAYLRFDIVELIDSKISQAISGASPVQPVLPPAPSPSSTPSSPKDGN